MLKELQATVVSLSIKLDEAERDKVALARVNEEQARVNAEQARAIERFGANLTHYRTQCHTANRQITELLSEDVCRCDCPRCVNCEHKH